MEEALANLREATELFMEELPQPVLVGPVLTDEAATLGWMPIRCWLPWSSRSEQGPPLSGDRWLGLTEWTKPSDLKRER